MVVWLHWHTTADPTAATTSTDHLPNRLLPHPTSMSATKLVEARHHIDDLRDQLAVACTRYTLRYKQAPPSAGREPVPHAFPYPSKKRAARARATGCKCKCTCRRTHKAKAKAKKKAAASPPLPPVKKTVAVHCKCGISHVVRVKL